MAYGTVPESLCNVRLARAARTNNECGSSFGEVSASGQLVDEGTVELGQRSKSNCSSVLVARKVARRSRSSNFFCSRVPPRPGSARPGTRCRPVCHRDGLTVTGTYYEYARGSIVLMVLPTSSLQVQEGLRVLLNPAVKKIAIANPAHAPYGQAAVAALKSQNLYQQVSSKLVTGENVSQAASFVISGAADAGIVAKSLAVIPSPQVQTRFVEIPSDEYPPITQACIILRSSKQQDLARRFESYMKSSEAAKILQKYGFDGSSATQQKSLQ